MLKKFITLLASILESDDGNIDSIGSPFGGTRKHIFVIRSGSTVTVYLDNVQVATGTLVSTPLELDSDNRIGLSHFDSNILQGEIDHLHFYWTAFDSTQRTALYNEEL